MKKANPTTTRVETTRFGAIEVQEEITVTLPEGLIGFEECKRYVVLNHGENSPFRWLQSLDNGAVAFPVMDPWQFRPDYAPTVSDADAKELGLDEQSPKLVFTIVTIPKDNPKAMTANLVGPVVINPVTRTGKQVVVTDDQYTTRHSIMDELQRHAVISTPAPAETTPVEPMIKACEAVAV
jgi:flagellar assembly factor FliW